jgi:hypothetical protein
MSISEALLDIGPCFGLLSAFVFSLEFGKLH